MLSFKELSWWEVYMGRKFQCLCVVVFSVEKRQETNPEPTHKQRLDLR